MKARSARLAARALFCAGALAVFGSCGGPNLSGSVGQYFSLDFDRQEILRDDNAFQVTYFHDGQDQVDVVVRITVVTTGYDFKPGHSFDLSGEYAPGHPRAVVTHAAGGEPSRQLPPIKHGSLTLSSGGQPGQDTKGTFSCSFEMEGGDFGQGTDVNGTFETTTTDATPDGGL
ncbi:MAG: hypothetical protein JST54_28700 [Deltaproteobacteria bacterium]|nr:hypothetical protein [Deltaproteobacteria bacterium]